MHGGRLKTVYPRIPTNNGGTEHVGLPPTRQALLARGGGRGRERASRGFEISRPCVRETETGAVLLAHGTLGNVIF